MHSYPDHLVLRKQLCIALHLLFHLHHNFKFIICIEASIVAAPTQVGHHADTSCRPKYLHQPVAPALSHAQHTSHAHGPVLWKGWTGPACTYLTSTVTVLILAMACVYAVAKLQFSGAGIPHCCSHVCDVLYSWLDHSSRCGAQYWCVRLPVLHLMCSKFCCMALHRTVMICTVLHCIALVAQWVYPDCPQLVNVSKFLLTWSGF